MIYFSFPAKNWQFSANVCPSAQAAHACYYHKINDQLSVGLEFEGSGRLNECTGTMAYQLEIPNSSMTFRGETPYWAALTPHIGQLSDSLSFG